MIKHIVFLFFLSSLLGSFSAQTFNVNINPFPVQRTGNTAAGDSLKILAVMVNFQLDNDDATFGNGTFGTVYSKDYGTSIIDPLPHDKAYFESHLQFVKNYYEKASSGKLKVSYTVLPDTITVSKTMRNYSPPPKSDDFTTLGNFTKESWTIVKAKYPDINFSQYDVFTIFHAGAGRDISLPGSIGNERDLPSVYLSDKALKDIFGDNLSGLPSNISGEYNTMIIPETESRELESLSGDVLFEITINGLLVASAASHLGLPDLFDTETGLSAIGRFGLMDGQSIFAYSGVFPPEPSAWEKIYLGWITPEVVNIENVNVTLTAKAAAEAGDTLVLKVPINSSEYYLVENRQRDVSDDGARLTYIINGQESIKVFPKDTTGFNSAVVDSLSGVITDVDELDWALPGDGIIIWHIDENIIDARIAENKINADKDNRGVDVEEADGVQDIGETFFDIFGEEVVAEGGQQDMWFKDNPALLYENIFGSDTRPNTHSNEGANSLITISNFSENGNKMSFSVNFGDSLITPLLVATMNITGEIDGVTSSVTANNLDVDILAGELLYSSKNADAPVTTSPFSDFKTASFISGGVVTKVGALNSNINILREDAVSTVAIPTSASSAPVVVQQGQEHNIIIGTTAGTIVSISYPGAQTSIEKIFGMPVKYIAAENNFIAAASEDSVYFDGTYYSGFEGVISDITLTKNASGNYVCIVLSGLGNIKVITSSGIFSQFTISSEDTIKNISLADLKRDGSIYIVYAGGNYISAVNVTGAYSENFKFTDPAGIGFTGTPLAADFEGNGSDEIIAYTKDGRIFAIDGVTGRIIKGFPLSTGAGIAAAPVIFNYNGKTSLAAINTAKTFYSFVIGADEGALSWPEENGNNLNNAFIEAPEAVNRVQEFFPSSRVYNYPNPVEGAATTIHYYVEEDSKINIKIFDLAGGFVDELNTNASGGFDGEVTWNVSGIQSGVYLARVEATSVSGKTENNIIKIAVVK